MPRWESCGVYLVERLAGAEVARLWWHVEALVPSGVGPELAFIEQIGNVHVLDAGDVPGEPADRNYVLGWSVSERLVRHPLERSMQYPAPACQ
jgi:hypothetical protein